ncbi:hypothetical protein PHLGIDRAFT_188897 [Phlebiopsis gigantea 11061_1 CR5-6]|uniref:Uncharacterized protein n=1 Tax=Phlebiopsis gigantea (strain 11061_1 CR5-6) TaxID=745531 RepID=A0A0C3S7B9_PHLG1|nr:hypothetical protein PHLGIDRAFT_188897 [Phlebiopsis gigantea 11061_1 CR5-6]
MQIHAPSPILSARPASPHTNMAPPPHPGPSSPRTTTTTQLPARPPMPRPPSRSERLLRDTLRRAEEHDRIAALAALPSPSLFGATQPAHGFVSPPPTGRRSRRNTSSSVNTDGSFDSFAYCDTGACYSDDEEIADDPNQAWLWRSPSVSSSSSGHGYFFQPQTRPQQPLPRQHSDDQETHRRGLIRSPHFEDITNVEIPDQHACGSPSSPTRGQLQRSPRSAPSVSQSSVSHSRASNAQSASRSPAEPERSTCGCQQAAVTPHEAVLRSRLEGVLRGAKLETDRRRSREREYNTGSSGSMASSRNMSGEDWFIAANELASPMSHRSELPSLSHSARTRASTNATTHARSYRSPSTSSQALRSPVSAGGPLTPPPTPPFNARVAAAQCKAMDGYVSFADIEGLGVPGGEDNDLEDDEARRSQGGRWLKWLPLSPKLPRERSMSASR